MQRQCCGCGDDISIVISNLRRDAAALHARQIRQIDPLPTIPDSIISYYGLTRCAGPILYRQGVRGERDCCSH